jgi:8-oxo-dGTP pyrophosphatase MutT (NUDIX family)
MQINKTITKGSCFFIAPSIKLQGTRMTRNTQEAGHSIMSFEPQKFFIGILDFFSILLPGALLTYLVKDDVGPLLLGRDNYDDLDGSQGWVAFAFTSYLLGQLLFLIGSLLDDRVYDPIRKRTDREQIARLLSHRKLSPKFVRWLAGVFFKKHPDEAISRVIPLKESYLRRLEAPNAVNPFQWCKARLAMEHPEALAMVNRFEADSKFFRSFIALLIGVSVVAIYGNHWRLAAGSGVLLVLAFWRYTEQRFKSTQQAYWALLTLETTKQPGPIDSDRAKALGREANPDQPTHAGGVVFREKAGQPQYLLVQAKENADQWVLPKGHIELGEDTQYTAVREVKEEAGVWARINEELKVIEYTVNDKPVRVRFYLMHAVANGKREHRWRKREWLGLDEAVDRATHTVAKELLQLAEQRRLSLKIACAPVRCKISI